MAVVVICPGFHPPALTNAFLTTLGRSRTTDWVFPADRYPPYSGLHVLAFLLRQIQQACGDDRSIGRLQQQIAQTPLLWIGFSAGVVGAIGAAQAWQVLGGRVIAFIALDGWGVPLWGDFPIHRVSHDAFTHWSSLLLGGNADHFYAEPSVGHLDLWRSPQLVHGYCVASDNPLNQENSGTRISNSAINSTINPTTHPTTHPTAHPTTTAAQFLVTLLCHYLEREST